MATLTILFCALFGLVFGSFLNVCIERLPRHESVVAPRSRCPQCATSIHFYDNLPLLSWVLLGGRCRHCEAPISRRYTFVEATNAGLFVACYLRFGLTVQAAALAAFCFLLLGLAVMDAETMLLPDSFTLPGVALGILYAAADSYRSGYVAAIGSAFTSLLAAALTAGLILLIRWSYYRLRQREGLGLGDAKLMAMLAAWLRLEVAMLALLLAVVSAAIFAAGMLAAAYTRPRGERRVGYEDWWSSRLPLGSFLAAAGIFCVFFGYATLKWYFSFFR